MEGNGVIVGYHADLDVARLSTSAIGNEEGLPVFTTRCDLSPSIVGLAAEGHTNREIAQEFFVTQRTVE